MKDESWVITYNDIDHGNKLVYDYETISGKNAKDALKKRFGKDFTRLTGDAGRYANVILVKGYYANGRIHLANRGVSLCFGIAQPDNKLTWRDKNDNHKWKEALQERY